MKTTTILLNILLFAFLLPTVISASSKGSIHFIDNKLNKKVPISGVRIEIVHSGGTQKVFTNSDGSFSFPSNTPKGRYRLTWYHKNSYFFLTSDGKNPDVIDGPTSDQPWNLTITNKRDHFHAAVFRAANSYVSSDFAQSQKLFRNLPINVHYRTKRFGGSGKARYVALNKEVYIWGINHVNDKPYDDLRLFGFLSHELAHAHHDHFYQGRSQHLDTEERLRESLAEASKYFLVYEEYKEKDFREFKTYSKQIPFYSGWRNYDWGRSKYFEIYTPLMIDLVDDFNQKEVDDRVSGYTMNQILNVMKEKECTDFDSFKRLLKQRYDNPTEQYLDILFREMGEKK